MPKERTTKHATGEQTKGESSEGGGQGGKKKDVVDLKHDAEKRVEAGKSACVFESSGGKENHKSVEKRATKICILSVVIFEPLDGRNE